MEAKDAVVMPSVRCQNCGKPIGHLYGKYKELVESGKQIPDVYKILGLTKTCCKISISSPSVLPSGLQTFHEGTITKEEEIFRRDELVTSETLKTEVPNVRAMEEIRRVRDESIASYNKGGVPFKGFYKEKVLEDDLAAELETLGIKVEQLKTIKGKYRFTSENALLMRELLSIGTKNPAHDVPRTLISDALRDKLISSGFKEGFIEVDRKGIRTYIAR